VNSSTPDPRVNPRDAYPVNWIIRTAACLAATRGLIDLIIERDRTRTDAAHLQIVLRSTETETDFATLPLTARTCDAGVIMIVAAIATALESRDRVGLDCDEEGLLRVRIMQSQDVGKFDPLIAAFIAAYNRESDAMLTRIDHEKDKDA
jgi:hypothetical protein